MRRQKSSLGRTPTRPQGVVPGGNRATPKGIDQPGILYQSDREYSEWLKRDGGVGQGPAFEALAPHQR
jgi:hypothetical protein